jgi:hypothetical protein
MPVETYRIGDKLYERRCIDCGAEIHECMGFCNGEDFLKAMRGDLCFIRERCGRCELQRSKGKEPTDG